CRSRFGTATRHRPSDDTPTAGKTVCPPSPHRELVATLGTGHSERALVREFEFVGGLLATLAAVNQRFHCLEVVAGLRCAEGEPDDLILGVVFSHLELAGRKADQSTRLDLVLLALAAHFEGRSSVLNVEN